MVPFSKLLMFEQTEFCQLLAHLIADCVLGVFLCNGMHSNFHIALGN